MNNNEHGLKNSKTDKDMVLVIVQDNNISENQAQEISKKFIDAGYTVQVLPPEEASKYEKANIGKVVIPNITDDVMRRVRHHEKVATVGESNQSMKKIVRSIMEIEKKNIQDAFSMLDKEPQHLVQKNNSDLPFYHNRRRW